MNQVHRNECINKFETNHSKNQLISQKRNEIKKKNTSQYKTNSALEIKTLVLDMDETLLHSSNVGTSDYDFVVSVMNK